MACILSMQFYLDHCMKIKCLNGMGFKMAWIIFNYPSWWAGEHSLGSTYLVGW